jgi:hypothetical protein
MDAFIFLEIGTRSKSRLVISKAEFLVGDLNLICQYRFNCFELVGMYIVYGST